MKAAWYEKQGPAKEVLRVGEMADPHPVTGEVRIRVAASGINPGDIKKRQDRSCCWPTAWTDGPSSGSGRCSRSVCRSISAPGWSARDRNNTVILGGGDRDQDGSSRSGS